MTTDSEFDVVFLLRGMFSVGADKVAVIWDATTGEKVKKIREHTSYGAFALILFISVKGIYYYDAFFTMR